MSVSLVVWAHPPSKMKPQIKDNVMESLSPGHRPTVTAGGQENFQKRLSDLDVGRSGESMRSLEVKLSLTGA